MNNTSVQEDAQQDAGDNAVPETELAEVQATSDTVTTENETIASAEKQDDQNGTDAATAYDNENAGTELAQVQATPETTTTTENDTDAGEETVLTKEPERQSITPHDENKDDDEDEDDDDEELDEEETKQFETLTRDVTFFTKVRLLLWKNSRIQCIRRPCSCACKLLTPVFIMMIMFFISLTDTEKNRDAVKGYEFDYLLGNSEQAILYQHLSTFIDTSLFSFGLKSDDRYNGLPYPDTSVMFPWIKYIVCPRLSFSIGLYDDVPPSYLAIIPNLETTSDPNLQNLYSIMQSKYGNTIDYYTQLVNTTLNEYTTDASKRRRLNEISDYFLHKIDSDNQNDDFDSRRRLQRQHSASYSSSNFSCWENAVFSDYLNFTEGSLLKFFDSEKEMVKYIEDSLYGGPGYTLRNEEDNKSKRPIGGAIVFDEVSSDGKDWTYTFRFNSSNLPVTENLIDHFTRNSKSLFFESSYYYIYYSGFLQLQAWLDHAIMESIAGSGYDDSYTDSYQKGAFMFPTAPYLEDLYWNYVGGSFVFFMLIMFSYPIVQVMSVLVEEKASKIKEGMKMMGSTTSSYWVSWFIWFFIEFSVIAFLVALVSSWQPPDAGVFKYSDMGVIFFWFWLFCLSAGSFAVLLSTFFDNPKTASLVGFIFFLASIIGGSFHGTLDRGQKGALCLLAPACFTVSMDNLVRYETAAIGLHWDNIGEEYASFSFDTCLIMMFIDTIIYSVLAIYFDQVWPSRYGQKLVPWFFLLPSYWGCSKEDLDAAALVAEAQHSQLTSDVYEDNKNGADLATAINVRHLVKIFKTGLFGRGKEVRAVDNISIDMRYGEIFCLLGHNGAGKTTTISMLTGLIEPTAGDAWIADHHIEHEMLVIRKNLGVCPQHNVLWDRLTCREHLWLFSRLKGVPLNRVKDQVEQTLEDCALQNETAGLFPTAMSGGEKRKLSLGIALIGGSKIVFLDEPTSGMDPQSRRVTWDLISREKKHRCIILTTHFMDEADVLGDRIAIMGSGRIKCCGSSLYLKRLYGVGYTFTVSLNAGSDVKQLKPLIDDHVLKAIRGSEEVALAGAELTYRLPFESTASFPGLFAYLDKKKDKLNIRAYGISVTTLEEVFLRIGHDVEDGDEVDEVAEIRRLEAQQSSNIVPGVEKENKDEDEDEDEDEDKDKKTNKILSVASLSVDADDADDALNGDDKNRNETKESETQEFIEDKTGASPRFPQPTFQLQDQNSFEIFFRHTYAILYKRFWWSLRDSKAIICQLFCPVAISALILGLLNIQIATDQPNIELDIVDLFDSVDDVFIPTARYSGDNKNYKLDENNLDNLHTDEAAWLSSWSSYMADDFGQLYFFDDFEDDISCNCSVDIGNTVQLEAVFVAYNVSFNTSKLPRYSDQYSDGNGNTFSFSSYPLQYCTGYDLSTVTGQTDYLACFAGYYGSLYSYLPSGYQISLCSGCSNYLVNVTNNPNYSVTEFIEDFTYSFEYDSAPGITHSFQQKLADTVTEKKIPYNAFWWPLSNNESVNPITNRVFFGFNASAYHALPMTLNLWNNWILNKMFDSEARITVHNHPLPVTDRQDLISSQISGFFAALYLVIAFTFIPAGAIYFIVNEKANLTKHQQLVSGISFVSYWCANYIADFLVGLPATLLVFSCVYIFDNEAFNSASASGPFLLTMLMFLFSALPFTYLLSFLFEKPSKAQLTTILLYIMLGMVLGLVDWILGWISSTQETNEDLQPLYRFFPVYLMTNSLLNISLKKLLYPTKSYFAWKVTGRNLVLMLVEGIGYFALVLLIEYMGTFPALLAKLGFVVDMPIQEEELDEDVLAERKRIQEALREDKTLDTNKLKDTVVLAGLRKVYAPQGRIIPCLPVDDSRKHAAVNDLWFSVPQGQVFGFLGVNGAGKTTALATLTAERYASAGTAFVHGFPISNQLQCRRYVGYCPQFDSIFELLTGREHLKFYAMIKGLSGPDLEQQTQVLLDALTLKKYENRVAGTYSGGNKRKLSVAVSMIGNPPVIFLDEPSTGMDPVSRRHMWEFISETMQGRCVIITTHSMEECEALCQRLAIMVSGQLRCIGTTQHLKSRFGKGHQLDLTLGDDSSKTARRVERQLRKSFNMKRIEKNGAKISYEINSASDSEMNLSEMFSILERLKQSMPVQSYALSQTTLEQIFIRMAKAAEVDELEGKKSIGESIGTETDAI